LYVSKSEIFYLNKISSKDKIDLLPPVGKIKIRNAYLRKINFNIEDRAVFPTFKIRIDDINLTRANFDFAQSLEVLFKSRRGSCKIGLGKIITERRGKNGVLRIKGLTLGEIISLDYVPIMPFNEKIYMIAEFVNEKGITKISGNVGRLMHQEDAEKTLDHNELKQKIAFGFQVKWEEYRLPFDLGLRKLLNTLVSGTIIGGVVDKTLDIISRLISPSENKPKEKEVL
jgi:hypothetical protein